MTKDVLFDTEEKIEAAIDTLKIGMSTPFWELITKILRANIKFLTEQILNGGDFTKEQMDRLRDKLKIHEEMIDTPRMIIEKYTSSEGEEPNLDPFHTAMTLKEEEKKNA